MYLIRLDDACPYMDRGKWQLMEDILDKYGVKPLVGIIPSNEDLETIIESEDNEFWSKIKAWEEKGWKHERLFELLRSFGQQTYLFTGGG